MNFYDHRFSALTLPSQGELRNKEPKVALRYALSAKCEVSSEYAPLWSSLPWPEPEEGPRTVGRRVISTIAAADS